MITLLIALLAPSAPPALAALLLVLGVFAGVRSPVTPVRSSLAPQLTHVTIGHSNDAPTWAPLWLADEAGFLRRHGLDAEVRSVGPGAVSIAALTSGDVQVLFTGGPGAVAGALDGADVVIVGGYLDRMPFHVVTRPDVASVAALRGEAVAVNAFGGASDWVMRYVLQQAGLEPERDVRLLALGTDAERLAGLRDGTIAATILAPPWHVRAEREGLHVLLDTATLPVRYSQSVIVAERAYVTAHPDVVAAVLQATAEGLDLYKSDADRAMPVLAAHLGMSDPALVRATWDYYRQAYSADLEPRGLEIILAEALRERPARAGTRVEDLLDLRFVPAVGGVGE